MKIAVCLKQVPDPHTVEVDPISGALDASRLLYVLNPADAAALELALRLSSDTRSLLALSVGPPAAEAVLREALATGVGQVVRLWDRVCNTAAPFTTASLLAAALRAEGLPDLVLCGVRSADRGSGQVPALLAELLGWPVLTDVTRIELQPGTAHVQRRLERGAREEVEVQLPAVLAIEPGVARLRHASLPGVLAAQRATIPVRTASDLRLSPADLAFPAPLARATTPPRPRSRPVFTPDSARPAHERIGQILSAGVSRKSGTMLEGPPEQMAAAIIDFLSEHSFIDN